ncbi:MULTISPECIES: hypothetical protein [Polaromonas]|uniref:Uncharacterized protein n=1 Tax=Polaromonas aquatica TaxID=332657 RepID=A0ABW1TVL3_9BURK
MNLQPLVDAPGERVRTPFSLALSDGSLFRSGEGKPAFHVVVRSDAAFLRCVTREHIGLISAYFDQEIDIVGDLGAALAEGMTAGLDQHLNALNHVENELHELRFSNCSREHAKANACSFLPNF